MYEGANACQFNAKQLQLVDSKLLYLGVLESRFMLNREHVLNNGAFNG